MSQKFKEIKKQFLYYLEHIQSRIVESNAFNIFKEKYQSYSLFHQKIIKYGFVGLVILLISFIPSYYFYLSSEHWSEFKEKRELSLGLLRVRSYQSTYSNVSSYRLQQNISDIIKKYKEKDYVIKDKPISSKEKKIKKIIYEVKVNHLNIRQVIQMGSELNDILSAYLSSLIVEESNLYPKHYDVSFELSAYFHKIKKSPRPRMKNQNKKSRFKKDDTKKDDTKKDDTKKDDTKKEPFKSRFKKDDTKKEPFKVEFKKDDTKKEPFKVEFKKDDTKKEPFKSRFKKDDTKKEPFKVEFDEKPKVRKKLLNKNPKEIKAR